MFSLSTAHLHCDDAAFTYLKANLWPNCQVCPHCSSFNPKHCGLSKTCCGLRKSAEKQCHKQFTTKVGTIFERPYIPLHKVLQAVYLLCASKKDESSHQIHRALGLTYKSAWFLTHRIMRPCTMARSPQWAASST